MSEDRLTDLDLGSPPAEEPPLRNKGGRPKGSKTDRIKNPFVPKAIRERSKIADEMAQRFGLGIGPLQEGGVSALLPIGTPIKLPKNGGMSKHQYFKHLTDDTVIINRLAEGETLKEILKDPGMPPRHMVYRWVAQNPYNFGDRYRAAIPLQMDSWADDMMEIARDQMMDVRRSKLIGEVMKWQMSKNVPGKWGDKLTLAGDKDNPLQINVARDLSDLTNDELEALQLFTNARALALEAQKLPAKGDHTGKVTYSEVPEEGEDTDDEGNDH